MSCEVAENLVRIRRDDCPGLPVRVNQILEWPHVVGLATNNTKHVLRDFVVSRCLRKVTVERQSDTCFERCERAFSAPAWTRHPALDAAAGGGPHRSPCRAGGAEARGRGRAAHASAVLGAVQGEPTRPESEGRSLPLSRCDGPQAAVGVGGTTATLLAPGEPCWSQGRNTAVIGLQRDLSNGDLCFWEDIGFDWRNRL